MKRYINIVLPIALASLLPLIRYYASSSLSLNSNKSFFSVWLGSFIFIILIWYAIQHIYNSNSNKRIFTIIGFILLTVLAVHVADVQFGIQFKLHQYIRLLFTSALIFVIQFAIKTQQNNAQLLLEKEQLQSENLKSQIKVLRQKIEPHFLFNSLNTLRSMVRKQHQNSEQFIINLSDFYRLNLNHGEQNVNSLAEEIKILESYLFLMKCRNDKAIDIKFNIGTAYTNFNLPTMALQLVAENCFKHNSMTAKKPIIIEVFTQENEFICVKNNLQPKFNQEITSGKGLKLLEKRYILLGIKKGVEIEKTDSFFLTKLKLLKN